MSSVLKTEPTKTVLPSRVVRRAPRPLSSRSLLRQSRTAAKRSPLGTRPSRMPRTKAIVSEKLPLAVASLTPARLWRRHIVSSQASPSMPITRTIMSNMARSEYSRTVVGKARLRSIAMTSEVRPRA
ncbi:hypothetical protein M885DRAFT_545533 [Pelagophyceae sp. CCMP2097]|nr:hypothetical protein M885DRAFT_545533 [Pelagophyceae sp. CCMP2097]